MEHAHLHENERLLAELRPGWSAVVSALVTVIFIVAVAIMLFIGLLAADVSALWSVFFALLLGLPAAFIGWLRVRAWKGAYLLVTTDRLLFHYPKTLLTPSRLTVTFVRRVNGNIEHKSQASDHSTVTVKWPQYQESHSSRQKFFGLMDRTRPLSVRYGTADAEREVAFPSVPFAQDLKHYLDKIDSTVRQNKQETLRPFVLKPSGQRDEA